jgi:hypothetical protein
MSFSILFIDSNDRKLEKSSFELRIVDVLSSTGLSDADASYTLPENRLKRKAIRRHNIIKAIYKYFSEATFRIKYLRGAIDESGSMVFNMVLIFIESLNLQTTTLQSTL